MKNYDTLDGTRIMGQLDLASAHTKLSSGKRLFTNFYIVPSPLYSEKVKKPSMYTNTEIYIRKGSAKLKN